MTTDYKMLVKMYRAYIIALAAVALAALLAYWLFRGYAGRREVGAKMDEIKQTSAVNASRVETIIDAAKNREEAAKRETAQNIGTVSDDDLPDVLAGLLAEYRREHAGR